MDYKSMASFGRGTGYLQGICECIHKCDLRRFTEVKV